VLDDVARRRTVALSRLLRAVAPDERAALVRGMAALLRAAGPDRP
jgi:hypothetical protein